MKKKHLLSILLSALFLLSALTACGSTDTERNDESDIFRFEDYESEDVFNIEKIDLGETLAASCTSYKFTYLSDGMRIKGYLSIPASAIASQKPAKCILYNRGGNRDYGMLGDTDTASICSELDRVVIASQYRGGGGSQGNDEFGGDDLHDVIQLIDLCENRFSFVDMDDFVVAGVSRGGMMTYLTARRDSRVKRIIAMSAVSNLFESYESREDMQEVMLETIRCTPQQDPAAYEQRSAIYWYDEIKVPVLMFHSKKDAQVSYSQAEALYEKLKDVTDCTFIRYDDDVHGLHPEDFSIMRDWLNQE